MAGNLAFVEYSPEIGFLLKQTENHAAGGKLFTWLPGEESCKNTIHSALTVESIGIHWKTKSSYLGKISDKLFHITVNVKYTLMIFFLITLFFFDITAFAVYSPIKEE